MCRRRFLLRSEGVRSDSPTWRQEPDCPASSGATVTHPGMAGVAVGKGLVTAILGQSGDLAHGTVDLGTSNVAWWYGLKTDWVISPRYSGWVGRAG